MVWRNDNYRIRRRLPSVPSVPKNCPTLTNLHLRGMLSPISSDDDIEQSTLLMMNDNVEQQLPLSECLRQSWTPAVKLAFPVYSNQRRELPIEESMESYGKFKKKKFQTSI
ncbi:unnamed protein product [Brugia pahangi]|uniref:Uncharacterized protein n=1 Tax=Brugia pahangi TaxID=6280 RepID=A0A0N4TLT1_BRUPA|nr:unnamed protein product [Brugia pahangi]